MNTEPPTIIVSAPNAAISRQLPGLSLVQRLRRPLAFMLDFFFFTWIVAIARQVCGLTPLSQLATVFPYTPPEMPVAILLLTRDWLFAGRGLGKRLLGLRTVDVRTGMPPSLWQSVRRNFLLLGPLLVCYAVASVGPLPKLVLWGQTAPILVVLAAIATVYAIIVFLYESFCVLWQARGTRLADRLAGTATLRTET